MEILRSAQNDTRFFKRMHHPAFNRRTKHVTRSGIRRNARALAVKDSSGKNKNPFPSASSAVQNPFPQMRHTAFIDRILADADLLEKLHPTEPGDAAALRAIRAATDDELTGGKPPADPDALALVRAALLYAHDAIDEAHRIVQDAGSDAGAYLHGM